MGSLLFRELTPEELSAVVSDALNTEMLDARLLTGGLFNTTYLVETQAYGATVLRVGPVNRHLLMPFEHRLMEAEEYVYGLCAEHKVPVSEILCADTSKTLLDRDFMFVRYLPSQPMSQVQLDPTDCVRVVRRIGEATARLHSITASRFGRVAQVKHGGGFDRWSEALIHELCEWETVGVPASIFTAQEHKEIRGLFEAAIPFLDEITQPQLVHADLWAGNILIRNDTERPEFGAIIDADRAIWGDAEFEFSSIRWTHSQPHFWEGYGRPLSYDPSSLIRRSVYTLLNRLWNAYVYLIEYDQPEQAKGEADDARAQMLWLKQALGR